MEAVITVAAKTLLGGVLVLVFAALSETLKPKRFASLLAALVSQFAGSGPAGPLLALPAILIASLTLIADDDGIRAAVDDARGAILGAVGLVAFAVVCWR